MIASEPLPPSTVRFIEAALAGGKHVGADLLQRYSTQTGRQVPAMPSPSTATRSKPSASRAGRIPKAASGSDRSFVAVHRDALALIVKKVEGTNAAFSVSSYVALRWLAFEAYQPDGPFSTTIALIAHRAGLSYNTTAQAVRLLEAIGVVTVQGQHIAGTKLRGPSLYTFPTIRGALPTEAPPRRAERSEEGEKRKESLSGACWPEELPIAEAEAIAKAHSCTVECVNRWYADWVARKIEFGDPISSSPARAFAQFAAAVRADRNRPLPKGSQASGFADPVKPLPNWALDDRQLEQQRERREPRYRP